LPYSRFDCLSEYLYPNGAKLVDKNASPWEKYEQINDIDDQIRENLKKISNDQLDQLKNGKLQTIQIKNHTDKITNFHLK
jgi:hypothetical protein